MEGRVLDSPALNLRSKKRYAADVSSADMPVQQRRRIIKLTADSTSAAYAAGATQHAPRLKSAQSGQHGMEGQGTSSDEVEAIALLMGLGGVVEDPAYT